MVDLVSAVSGTVGSLIGATAATPASSIVSELVTNVALGAASNAIITSLQHPDIQKILDPLGLRGALPTATPAPAPAPAAKPNYTTTVAAWGALPPTVQSSLAAQFTIVFNG